MAVLAVCGLHLWLPGVIDLRALHACSNQLQQNQLVQRLPPAVPLPLLLRSLEFAKTLTSQCVNPSGAVPGVAIRAWE
jgi:hypothetical protein